MPKTLEELKKENEVAEAQAKLDAEEPTEELEDDEVISDDNEDDVIADDDVADDDNEDDVADEDKDVDIEPWMDTEDPSKKDKDFVPVGTHVEMKNKLKGRLSEKDDELEKLKAENLRLKSVQQTKPPAKPDPENYTDQAEYDKDLLAYEDWIFADRTRRIRLQDEQTLKRQEAERIVAENVDKHYYRAAKLLSKSGIAPELFKHADNKVRKTVESLKPGLGDVITDNLISTLGEGSEKVLYYLGVNEIALNKLQSLLIKDPTGLKAAVYLGQEKQRLTIQTKRRSKAPAPSKSVNGDLSKGGLKSLKRKYDSAKSPQEAYDIKQQAKKNGVDTKNW